MLLLAEEGGLFLGRSGEVVNLRGLAETDSWRERWGKEEEEEVEQSKGVQITARRGRGGRGE